VRFVIIFVAACGAAPPPTPTEQPPEMHVASLEWKAEQAGDGRVDVSLVVDGKAQPIGLLDAATEMEPGTPATCALRAAHGQRTELQCGEGNFYAAELHAGELVISINDGQRTVEVKRIPLTADALAVKPYAL
jgi:hypothetical protein